MKLVVLITIAFLNVACADDSTSADPVVGVVAGSPTVSAKSHK